ncbi:hypothetical protein [Natronorubrum halophilum]|uniref:hypothetical protein n=1 Tax=Natronorubrum halophilum TaxID=1702106 RepID=UPI0010C1B033|nr:hypothetical protein [Natronorubrum halophilum]
MDVPRRHILAGLGMAPLGGCSERFTSDSGIQLGSLTVLNRVEETHTVDVVLERDDSRVYHGMVEVDVDERVWIDPDWSSEPAEYELYYTVSGSDEVSIAQLTPSTVPSNTERECVFADILLVDGPHGPRVSLSSVEEVEEAECNS